MVYLIYAITGLRWILCSGFAAVFMFCF